VARDVFVVESPKTDDPGKYILIVMQQHGMFGGSSTSFAIDQLKYVNGPPRNLRPFSIQGIRGSKVVVEFSPDSSFIMFDRKLSKVRTMADMAVEDRRDEVEASKLMEKEFPAEKLDAVATTADGRTKVNTQGYL
jgi:hypothetical protein